MKFERLCLIALGLANVPTEGDSFVGSLGPTKILSSMSSATREVRKDAVASAKSPSVGRGRSTKARHMSQDVFGSMGRGGGSAGGIYDEETGLGSTNGGVKQRPRRDDGRSPDFEINLGKVIDTLRRDYPRIFSDPPDFDIYTADVVLRDPTGVVLTGVKTYKRLFATLRFFRQILMNEVLTKYRVTYDWSKQQVRFNWNLVIGVRGRMKPLYVDGISVYTIDTDGLISQHDLETIVVNGTPVEPPFAYAWINLPAWISQPQTGQVAGGPGIAHPFDLQHQELITDVGVVLAAATSDEAESSNVEEGTGQAEIMSSDAAEDVEPKPKGMRQQRDQRKKKKGWGWSMDLPNSCDTSFDCSNGQVCCDFKVVKMCCSNGIRVPEFIPLLLPANEPEPPASDPWKGGY